MAGIFPCQASGLANEAQKQPWGVLASSPATLWMTFASQNFFSGEIALDLPPSPANNTQSSAPPQTSPFKSCFLFFFPLYLCRIHSPDLLQYFLFTAVNKSPFSIFCLYFFFCGSHGRSRPHMAGKVKKKKKNDKSKQVRNAAELRVFFKWAEGFGLPVLLRVRVNPPCVNQRARTRTHAPPSLVTAWSLASGCVSRQPLFWDLLSAS